MRELIAKGVLILTFAAILAVAALFAERHNRVQPTVAAPSKSSEAVPGPSRNDSPPTAVQVELGRRVFAEQNCTTCHAIAGVGSPRYPLDDVGSRRSIAEIRLWITGTGGAAAELPTGIQRRKQRYQTLSEDELNALAAYLSTLR